MIAVARHMISENPRLVGVAILAFCVLALGSAFVAQYIFDLQPCELCLYQRVPFFFAGILSLYVIFGKPGGVIPRLAVGVAGVTFLVGAGLAFFHVGVEQQWWTAFTSCSGEIDSNLGFDELKAAIMAEPIKRCDEITWTFLGLSITVYNTLFSLGLAAATFISLGWMKRPANV